MNEEHHVAYQTYCENTTTRSLSGECRCVWKIDRAREKRANQDEETGGLDPEKQGKDTRSRD
jgi:hypothetical protein